MEKGKLYIVATPIGNLEDITLRAIRVLKSVGLVAAEDTRRSRRLLNHYQISTPATSYHDYTSERKRKRIIARLMEGMDVALISDAGTPGISDPGYRLVADALSEGIAVLAVPGPSVVTASLSVSGLPTDRFYFAGYLPTRKGARRERLQNLSARSETIIIHEAPHRVLEALEAMAAAFGNRRIAVVREMTKLHEEIFRGTIEAAVTHLQSKPRVRGEFTLVVAGASLDNPAGDNLNLAEEIARVIREQKVTRKDAVRIVAETYGIPKNQVYRASLGK
jgi:16S rRNA (cytidine1402-2'-O)-methyltransferase